MNTADRFGLYEQVHLAVTPDKLCLGVVGAEFFDHATETLGKSAERSTWPIEQKESFRWLQGYRSACELAAECPQTQIVSVADREADIYDIFVDAQQQSGLCTSFSSFGQSSTAVHWSTTRPRARRPIAECTTK